MTSPANALASLRPPQGRFDAFGFDPAFEAKLAPTLDRLADRYFRIQIEGNEHLQPVLDANGNARPTIVVANHGGALPFDAVLLRWMLKREGLQLRPLLEDPVMTAPFIGSALTKLGCVRASQENATRVLATGAPIAVFPEGAQGLGKLYKHRHRLMRFGRGGFVRLALRTGAALVPVAMVGPEDSSPLLSKWRLLFKGTAADYVPITPVVPLPARWSLRIGPPVVVADALAEDADRLETMEFGAKIRERIQADVEELAGQRTSIWRG